MSGGDDETPAAPTQVKVPVVVGQTPAAATKLIEDAGLTVGTVTEQASPADQEGLVTASTPAAGALADPDTEVDLVVGSGPGAVAIPGVVGLDVEQAQSNLGSAGFTRITIDRVDSAQPEGEVISVDPEAGSEVPLDTAITLEVSDGDVAVPDVRGQDQATATKALRDAGFSNITPEAVDAPEAEGTALGTSPGAGSQASADTEITLQVSGGPAEPTEPEAIEVPDVVGQAEARAREILTDRGFTNVTSEPTEATDNAGAGEVAGTEPVPGTKVAPDEEIILLVVPN